MRELVTYHKWVQLPNRLQLVAFQVRRICFQAFPYNEDFRPYKHRNHNQCYRVQSLQGKGFARLGYLFFATDSWKAERLNTQDFPSNVTDTSKLSVKFHAVETKQKRKGVFQFQHSLCGRYILLVKSEVSHAF